MDELIPIYRTTEMEKSVLALAKHFPHVLVRAISVLENPIRIRTRALGNSVYLSRNADAGDRQIAAWLALGGVLINHKYAPRTMSHEAQLLCECPLSKSGLLKAVEQTSRVAVIYQTPGWDEHRKAVSRMHPRPTVCKLLHATMRQSVMDNDQIAICNALNLPYSSLGAVYDQAMATTLGVRPSQLKRLFKLAFLPGDPPKTYSITRLVPLVVPEDKSLVPMYRQIEGLPEVGGVRLLVGNQLNQSARFWKTQLHDLVRSGAVNQLPSLTFYRTYALEPDYAKVQRAHDEAQSELSEMIDLMKTLPLFTSRAARRSASRPAPLVAEPRSSSRSDASRGSSARTRGTAG